MKNWKQFVFTAVFLLIGGVFYVNAQDMIILKDGNIIEAKVVEISPAEIRYKRFDHLDGPTIVIPATDVLSIRYENGRTEVVNAAPIPKTEVINAAPIPKTGRESSQTERPQNTAMDPDKFIFGINANAGGAIGYIWQGATGTGINIELGKGNFNSEINLMFPIGGFGILATFNGFWPSRIGGFYLGGGVGYSTYLVEVDERVGYYDEYERDNYSIYRANSLTLGLNAGYKFVTKSGFYVRTGTFVGFDFGILWNMWNEHSFTMPVYIKPDLAIGWTMR